MALNRFMLRDTYPVQSLELAKADTHHTVDSILDHLHRRIEADSRVAYIATFDHYSHTTQQPEHEIADDIRDARLVLFCFGLRLPVPEAPAARPRSISVVETDDRFVISFMEAPMPLANNAMTEWVEALNEATQDA
ncbi:MAG: DUF6858 family protein [Halorhodospira sp.]